MNPAAAGAIEIFVFKGGRFLGSRCFSQGAIVIGRGRSAALKLQDPSVAEQHARLHLEGDSIILSDISSPSGVFVNGERITSRAVSSFDEVRIGPFRLKVSLLGQEEEDPGFGAADAAGVDNIPDDAATVVRKVEYPVEYPDQPGQPEQATVPRIVKHREQPAPYGQLAPKFPGPTGGSIHEEEPTKAETPGRIRQEEFEDFSRRPPPQVAPDTEPLLLASPPDTQEVPDSDIEVLDEEPLSEEIPSMPPSVDFDGQEEDRPGDEDDEDEDDDERAFVEPFSLLENVVRERFKTKVPTEHYAMVEVIHYEGSEIQDLLRADPGQRIRIGVDNFHLVSLDRDGRASVYFKSDFKGTMVSRGKARPLKSFFKEKYTADRQGRLFSVSLREGDYAQLIRGSSGYLVRFVKPPKLPKLRQELRINWGNLQIFVGSAAFHFLLLVLLGFVAPEADLTMASEAERFAKVTMKDLKLEKPKEEPKKEEPKQEEPKPEPTKESPKVPPKVKRRVKIPMSTRQKQVIQKKQVSKVLSALENIAPKDSSPGRSDLKSLMKSTNIAAIRTPGGTSGGFKIGDVVKKIPGGGVRLAGSLGGGGGRDTRVGSQLLSGSGSKIGQIVAAAGTGGRVRGRVRRAPKRAISATGGVLDRGAIQKVVNQHMAEIQRCYEVQLLKNPGLAGKIVFDWTISMSGGVSSARQVSSNMSSPAVATCILARIRTWQFPRPVGGAVQVRYPFVFRVQGF